MSSELDKLLFSENSHEAMASNHLLMINTILSEISNIVGLSLCLDEFTSGESIIIGEDILSFNFKTKFDNKLFIRIVGSVGCYFFEPDTSKCSEMSVSLFFHINGARVQPNNGTNFVYMRYINDNIAGKWVSKEWIADEHDEYLDW